MGIFAWQGKFTFTTQPAYHITYARSHSIRSRVSFQPRKWRSDAGTDIALALDGSRGITYEVCTKSDKRKREKRVGTMKSGQIGGGFPKV